MYRNTNKEEAEQVGLWCAGKKHDATIWKEKEYEVKTQFKTLSWFTS
jgi:hypothetical protein